MNRGSDIPPGPPSGYFLVVPPAGENDPTLDLQQLLPRLWLGRLWVAGAVVVLSALALLHVVFATRIYRAETIVIARAEDLQGSLGMFGGQLGGLASLAGLQLNAGNHDREEYFAHLKSRTLARKFIEQRNLLPVLYYSSWDEASTSFRGRPPTIGDAVDFFVDDIRSIRQDAKTGLVTLTFEWRDPVLAADWANGYVALANETLRSQSLARAKQSINYLNDELGRTTLEPVRQSIFRLMEGRINEVMFANVEPEFAFKVVDRAVPAEERKFIRPRPVLEVALALFAGFVLGGLLALWRTRETRKTA